MDGTADAIAQAQPNAVAPLLGSDPGVTTQLQDTTGELTVSSADQTATVDPGPASKAQVHEGGQGGQPAAEQALVANTNPQLEEVERELQKAQDNPADFSQWMSVEKLVDKLGNIEKSRQVYDGLLSEFPLCYGYWRKYAEAEHKHTSPEWAVNVYTRGVAATPYSSDLWGYYCNFKQKIGTSPDEMRELFEQGIAYVGTDYLAHGVWDKYIKYEISQGAYPNVARLYVRILGCPLKELDRYLKSLKTFVGQRPALDLMTADEYSSIASSLKQSSDRSNSAPAEANPGQSAENGDVAMEVDEDGPPGDGAGAAVTPMQGNGEPGPLASDPQSAAVTEAVSEEEIKAHWLAGVEALYNETKEEVARRKPFEDSIKRPYFHVKPLDQNQLAAWSAYLDYALQKDDAGVIVRLFERCLVACASYPEFWIRYIRYLEKGDASSALGAVQRAQHVHCKRNATLHLYAASFYERSGDIGAAREAYQIVLTKLAEGLVEAVIQAASFERRQGNEAAARELFEGALAKEEPSEGKSDNGAILAIFFANFLALRCRDTTAAREVFKRALERWKGLRYLWEAAIHLEEYCIEAGREERVAELYRQALAEKEGLEQDQPNALPDGDVEELSSQFEAFAHTNMNPAEAEKVAAAHAERFSQYAKLSRSKKRAAESAAEGGQNAKKNAVEGVAGQAVPSAAAGDLAAAASDVAQATSTDPAASGAYTDGTQPALSAATAAVAQAAYYPTASAAAYSYGYYQYPQQYGYSYPGY